MIRSMSAFATACLLANITFAQPTLVTPTPSDHVSPTPNFPASPLIESQDHGAANPDSIDQAPSQFNPVPVQDFQGSSNYDQAPFYQSVPSYDSYPAPSYNSAPFYEHGSSQNYSTPSYNSAPGYEYPPAYNSAAENSGSANCQNSNSNYGRSPASPNYFIGQSYSTFGEIPPSSPGDYAHFYQGGASTAGIHARHPYYSYRHSWFTPGPVSQNVTIAW